jgi:hypothetical protein
VQAPPGPRVVRAGVPQGELRIKLEGVGGSVLSLSDSKKTKKLVVDERSALLLRILFFQFFCLFRSRALDPRGGAFCLDWTSKLRSRCDVVDKRNCGRKAGPIGVECASFSPDCERANERNERLSRLL